MAKEAAIGGPGFLEVGKTYTFRSWLGTLVRGEVQEIDPAGWVKAGKPQGVTALFSRRRGQWLKLRLVSSIPLDR